MNILVICNYGLYEDLGSSFVHSQIREYAALGHHVRVIIPNGVAKKGRNGGHFERPLLISQADGVELYDLRYVTLSVYGKRHFNTASACAAIRLQWDRIFGDFQPDVIHAHTFGLESEIGVWLKAKLGCPVVVTTHGSDTTILVNKGRLKELYHYCEGIDVAIAVSNTLENRLRKCGTPTEIRTIHNGFHDEGIDPYTEKVSCSCLQVSHLIELKQVPVTIRAFQKIYKQYPQARLTIIGQGTERAALEKLCSELQISEAVTFTGQLPHREVLEHMSKTQFYIMPSVREGFPVSYLEAMGMGCVIVGTATEGISEIVDHEVNGFLVQPGDFDSIAEHVISCIADPVRSNKIAAAGNQTAQQLSWRSNAQQYIALFQELTAGKTT